MHGDIETERLVRLASFVALGLGIINIGLLLLFSMLILKTTVVP